MATNKPWGGRFQENSSLAADEFGASIGFDQLMANEDLEGSLAHVEMLRDTKIISAPDAATIITGLKNLQTKLQNGQLQFTIANEDIHMNIEALLAKEIGPVAGKLHTARSRNDQVATDFHLYLKKRLPKVIHEIKHLQNVLVTKAQKHIETIIPDYTHLQHAQPISYGHYLMAYFFMFQRDVERFNFNKKHTDISPLGAAALAGTTFPIDRHQTAKRLGFKKLYSNSIDAVSDRDFVLEFLSNAAILMLHLSRLSEEIILWSSYEFNYLELSDQYTTGSYIMPQKKNPDMAELIRGKSGRVFGHLMSLLTVIKALPLAYDKDLQEDKEGTFDTLKIIIPCLKIMSEMIATAKVKTQVMQQATTDDFSNATELADYLAAKGIPFRQAHAIVGKLVLKGLKTGVNLQDLPLAEYQKIMPEIDTEIYHDLQARIAVQRRQSLGGTSFQQVRQQIAEAQQILKNS